MTSYIIHCSRSRASRFVDGTTVLLQHSMQATVRVPRLNLSCSQSTVSQAIMSSVKKLGFRMPNQHQAKATLNFVKGRDVLVLLPTGSGKSICFVALPLIFESLFVSTNNTLERDFKPIVLVISPLTALMKDQVKKYGKSLHCAYIGDEQNDQSILDGVEKGCYHLVYTSPECILTVPKWRDMLSSKVYQQNLIAIAVDEAHCIESWGSEFRVEYSNISEILSIVSKTMNLIALTATASPETICKIKDNLCMEDPYVVRELPNKKNIKYAVFKKPRNILDVLMPIIFDIRNKGIHSKKTIIFCRTYNSYIEVSTLLVNELYAQEQFYLKDSSGKDIPVCQLFSASTSPEVKDEILQIFTEQLSPIRIIVATVAFGMGLDASDVREVIHFGPSDTIESHVQESGRCGRDRLPSFATLYYSKKDVSTKAAISEGMREYCGNKQVCRRKLLMRAFDTDCDAKLDCPKPMHWCCDVCEVKCPCNGCNPDIQISEHVIELIDFESADTTGTKKVNVALKDSIMAFRNSICVPIDGNGRPSPLFFGLEISSGIATETIIDIAKNYDTIRDVTEIVNYGIQSIEHAKCIYDIVKTYQHQQPL